MEDRDTASDKKEKGVVNMYERMLDKQTVPNMEDMIKLNNIPIGTVNAPINDYFNNNNSCCKEEK